MASITLFLCVMIPSGIVYWLSGVQDFLMCCVAFVWPLAYPMSLVGLPAPLALCFSGGAQGCAFWGLIRSRRLSPRAKLTIAVTWGMGFALLLKLFIAFDLYRQVKGA